MDFSDNAPEFFDVIHSMTQFTQVTTGLINLIMLKLIHICIKKVSATNLMHLYSIIVKKILSVTNDRRSSYECMGEKYPFGVSEIYLLISLL